MVRSSVQSLGLAVVGLAMTVSTATTARAEEPKPAARTTWGTPESERGENLETPPSRARSMLARARFLDEAAGAEERIARDLTAALPAKRTAATAARAKVAHGPPEFKDVFTADAENLEAELAVSEAEIDFRKRLASEDRAIARDLRVRAVRVARDAMGGPTSDALATSCDPPFYYSGDGLKKYRMECFR